MWEFDWPELFGPSGRASGVTAYLDTLGRTGAGEPELVGARQALRLLGRYTKSGRPDWRRTP